MEMAARAGDKSYESLAAVPAVQAVEGAPLTGVEFFGAGDAGLLLLFGPSRLEIMPGIRIEASVHDRPVPTAELHAALYRASGSPVRHIEVVRGLRMSIEFEDGLTLAVALQPDDRMGLESAAYYDASWRYEAY